MVDVRSVIDNNGGVKRRLKRNCSLKFKYATRHVRRARVKGEKPLENRLFRTRAGKFRKIHQNPSRSLFVLVRSHFIKRQTYDNVDSKKKKKLINQTTFGISKYGVL